MLQDIKQLEIASIKRACRLILIVSNNNVNIINFSVLCCLAFCGFKPDLLELTLKYYCLYIQSYQRGLPTVTYSSQIWKEKKNSAAEMMPSMSSYWRKICFKVEKKDHFVSGLLRRVPSFPSDFVSMDALLSTMFNTRARQERKNLAFITVTANYWTSITT